MKKFFLVGSLFLAVAFSSCKKDHTCSCTVSGDTVLPNYSKDDAQTFCDAANVAESIVGGTCTLD